MATLAEHLGVTNLTGRRPLEIGEPAPDFRLPALNRDGTIGLTDFRDRSAVLLAIERGLYCPFCRRHITHLGALREPLAELGVEIVAVVGTLPDRARSYLKFRPMRVNLAADPEFEIHREFGLPKFAATPEVYETLAAIPVNPFGDLPAPRPLKDLAETIGKAEAYEWTPADQKAYEVEQIQSTGQFLVDRRGIVRWRYVEGETAGLTSFARFPDDQELFEAARAL